MIRRTDVSQFQQDRRTEVFVRLMVMRRCRVQSPRRKVLGSVLLYTFFLVCIKTTNWRLQITCPRWICASSLLVPTTPLYNCSWEQVRDNGGKMSIFSESQGLSHQQSMYGCSEWVFS